MIHSPEYHPGRKRKIIKEWPNEQMQVGKSRKTCLTNHTWSISFSWLLMSLRADTHIPTCEPKAI